MRNFSIKKYDYLVVGVGFAGSVCARQLAAAGKSVLIIDKRSHIAGNAYDEKDEFGVLIHPYGPHIFHANSQKVLNIFRILLLGVFTSIVYWL